MVFAVKVPEDVVGEASDLPSKLSVQTVSWHHWNLPYAQTWFGSLEKYSDRRRKQNFLVCTKADVARIAGVSSKEDLVAKNMLVEAHLSPRGDWQRIEIRAR
jgi:hypothetical protein